jgi:hypothetical protein
MNYSTIGFRPDKSLANANLFKGPSGIVLFVLLTFFELFLERRVNRIRFFVEHLIQK